MKIEGIEAVAAALRARAAKYMTDQIVSAVVGYTQSYGIYVHENLTAHHDVGNAKFLERPAREMRDELAKIVLRALVQGKTMAQAVLLAALALQRASQQQVPVDTGALKNSAFTTLEIPAHSPITPIWENNTP